MKKLLALLCLPLLLVYTANAEPVNCILEPTHNKYVCDNATSTPVPTATSTNTPVAPTATATASSTPTPVLPTATPTIPVQGLPARSSDGTYYITKAGVYSGTATCGNIGITNYCVHLWAAGATLQDFTVTSGGHSVQMGSNTTLRRGTITGQGGVSGFRVTDVLIDIVTFNVSVGAIGIYDQGENCEALTTKRTRNITIRASTINNSNATGSETAWFKCVQGLAIEGNKFKSSTEWSISLPDTTDVVIRDNAFDLSPEPRNWLGVELPRTFRILVDNNTVTGPAGDWFVWSNSGTTGLTMTANTITGGMGTVCCVSPPSTGSGGLRH